jgi:hypothetical protein
MVNWKNPSTFSDVRQQFILNRKNPRTFGAVRQGHAEPEEPMYVECRVELDSGWLPTPFLP